MNKARYYEKTVNAHVQCNACEWHCNIAPDLSGLCGVRQNKKGELFSLVYGKAISVHVDPIEKKPFFHFMPGKEALSIGTIGCNFGCGFCQNWDISQVSKVIKREAQNASQLASFDAAISGYGYDLSPRDIIDHAVKQNYEILAYTYNEPTVFLEYALDTAKLAKEKGIRNVFVTNGFMSENVLSDISKYIDAANIDLKAFSDKFYMKHCKGKLEPVLRNIRSLYEKNVWLEITTLLIPGENDSKVEITKIAEFIAGISKDIPWHISKFHPDYEMLDKPETPNAILDLAYEIGKNVGLNYVYVGNVIDSDKEATKCPNCKELLINREGYRTEVLPSFSNGICSNCGQKIPGIWS